jgi:serine phosphatase RsbU (regulator of sigma subunit)
MPPRHVLIIFLGILVGWGVPTVGCHAQNQRVIDSLHRTYPALNDTLRVQALAELCVSFRSSVPDSGFYYARQALALATKLNYQRGEGLGLLRLGSVHYHTNQIDSALFFYYKALQIFEEIPDGSHIASTLNNIGAAHSLRGDYKTALGYYLKAEKSAKHFGDIKGQAYSNVTLGSIYRIRGDTALALEHYLIARNIYQKVGDKGGQSMSLQSLGGIYSGRRNYDSAILMYRGALRLRTELGDRLGVGHNLNKIATNHRLRGHLDSCLHYANQAMKIYLTIQDQNGQASVYLNLAQVSQFKGNCDEALAHAHEAYWRCRKFNFREGLLQAALVLFTCHAKQGDFVKAYHHQSEYLAIRDSIFNQENNRLIAQLQADMENQSLVELNREIAGLEAEQFWQGLALGGVGLALAVAIGFVYALLRNVRQKQAANQLLAAQKAEIEMKNTILQVQTDEILAQRDALNAKTDEIARKNEDIMASINYAERIQSAILPSASDLGAHLPEHFVLFKPRDVVSGDSYWFAKVADPATGRAKLVLAAIDCTGHGVPGAFMSMIADTLLNNVVISHGLLAPEKVLDQLRLGVGQALRQGETRNSDGMEIGLCVLDLEARQVTFAGARIPLVYVQYAPGEVPRLHEIKGDKIEIGGPENHQRDHHFGAHTLSLPADKTTILYLFSDGFQDQFGGPQNKKFMANRFRQLLAEISLLPLDKQQVALRRTIDEWMAQGQQPQVDDILVIGVRV